MSRSTDAKSQRSVVARVGALLNAISASQAPLTLSEVARRAGIPLSTAHRLLNELVEIDIVSKRDTRYVLDLHMFEIGLQIPWIRTLRETAEPLMNQHALTTQQVVNLGILRGVDVIYLAKVAGPGAPALPSRVGGRLPAHCTALGKVLLAHLERHDRDLLINRSLERLSPHSTVVPHVLNEEFSKILSDGVAYDREETSTGLFCVAAPVRWRNDVIAAVSSSARSYQVHDRLNVRGLQRLASDIESALDNSYDQIVVGA